MRSAGAAAFAAAILSMAACDRLPTEVTTDAPQAASAQSLSHVPVATRQNLLVTVPWLHRNLEHPNVLVLHFGTPTNYGSGHVPGARLIAMSAVQGTRDGVAVMLHDADVLREAVEAAGVSTGLHVIVTGDDALTAARGFFILEYLGHPRVSLLDGGRAAWQADHGLSTEATTADRPGRMVTPVRSGLLATRDQVQSMLNDPSVRLLDARPVTAYAAGHIPSAVSLPWAELVQSAALPLLKPVPQLRSRFALTGATVRTDVVAYCTSGMMSSVAYFVARYLGYDAILYDGSMLEWLARGLPLET
jgi:thiosulfate/3-mercaptopyruvate sulfurtransferase